MDTNEIMRELAQKIDDAIKEIHDGGAYKSYLKQAAGLHEHSPRNAMLIHSQNPNATHVASYKTWEALNRHVKKGEQGMAIFAPSKVTLVQPRSDGTGDETVTKIRFKATYVFDISQTEGEPLKNIQSELSGDMKNFKAVFDAIKNIVPCNVVFENILDGSNGYFSAKQNKIALRVGMSDEQTIKTLLHETAHCAMHTNNNKTREVQELQAESVAYMLCDFLSIHSGAYNFDYAKNWSAGVKLSELKTSLTEIQSTASDIIKKLETELAQMQKAVTISDKENNTLGEKLASAKMQINQKSNEKGDNKYDRPFNF